MKGMKNHMLLHPGTTATGTMKQPAGESALIVATRSHASGESVLQAVIFATLVGHTFFVMESRDRLEF